MSLSRHNSKGPQHPGGVTIAATVPPELEQTLAAEARRRHVSVSFLVRETLQRKYAARLNGQTAGASCGKT
jgi:predicted HicB family RNase H-like nuclease